MILLILLIIATIALLIIATIILDKKWFSPFYLFVCPFLMMYIIAGINASKWGLLVSVDTFLVFFLGELFFFIGCYIGKGRKNKCKEREIIHFKYKESKMYNKRILLLITIEVLLMLWQAYLIMRWGAARGLSFTEAINANMIFKKFDTNEEAVNTPALLGILLQINFIASFVFAYLIARKILFKDRVNIRYLIVGFLVSMLTNMLGGSRGPLVENIISIIIAFALVYYQKTSKNIFPLKVMVVLLVCIIGIFVGFFAILPLMGRLNTASNLIDEITQYIGAQVYNMNYYLDNNPKFSSFFGANTLAGIYGDLETFFKIKTNYLKGSVPLFFVKANGYPLGNVFTCYFSYYSDFDMIGIVICPLIMGWMSQRIFVKGIDNRKIINFYSVVYLYIAVNLLFSFFGDRFFTNVFNLKILIKFFWIYVIYWYITKAKFYFYLF